MPIDLASTSTAANRRDVLDIAPHTEPIRRSEPSPRQDRNDAQRSSQHERSDELRRGRDVPSTRQNDASQETGKTDKEPSDFEKSLQEGAQRNEAETPTANDAPAEEGQTQVNVTVVEGELALDLSLPAALGPEAVAQVQLALAETVDDPALAAVVVQGSAIATQQLLGEQETGLVLIAEDSDAVEVLAAAPQELAANTEDAQDQQLAVVVKVGGEEVPVTLHVQPKQQQQVQAQQVQQQLHTSANQAAATVSIDEQGNPLAVSDEVAEGAVPGVAAPGQVVAGPQDKVAAGPTLSQQMQQASAAKAIAADTVQAVQQVDESPLVQVRSDTVAEEVQALPAAATTNNGGQITIQNMRPSAEAQAAPALAAPPAKRQNAPCSSRSAVPSCSK